MCRIIGYLSVVAMSACSPSELEFELLVYNIAGLPEGFNDDQNPEQNVPLMGAKMASYDLVLVQEDFAYSQVLRQGLTQSQWSYSDPAEGLGDGLNQYANLDFAPELYRERWEQCSGLIDSGSDCLTSKGFSHSVVTAADTAIDVINFHMDAGQSPDDVAAREVQVAQLLRFTETLPSGRPLLMAGDTNLKIQGDLDQSARQTNMLLLELLDEKARDVCWSLQCGEPGKIDRVFFSPGQSTLAPTQWNVDTSFVNDEGEALSDHEANKRVFWSDSLGLWFREGRSGR